MKKRLKGLAALLLAMVIAVISPMTTFAANLDVCSTSTTGDISVGDYAYLSHSGNFKVVYKCKGVESAGDNTTEPLITDSSERYTIKEISEIFPDAPADPDKYNIPSSYTYSIKNLGPVDNEYDTYELTLTAEISLRKYTITMNLDGGTVKGDNPITYDFTNKITLPKPEKSGFTFKGWTGEGITKPNKSVTIEQGSSGDKTYTANWVEKSSKHSSSDDEEDEEETENVSTPAPAAQVAAPVVVPAATPDAPVAPVDPALLDDVPKTGHEDASNAFLMLGSILAMIGIAFIFVKKRERTE